MSGNRRERQVPKLSTPAKKYGLDGADFFAALRERGVAVELDQSADWVTVNGEKMTCGEFCKRFPWNGWNQYVRGVITNASE